jgi:SAM-dependent methyltransferase
MAGMRKPFQGVVNIIRFNWPYYVFSLAAIVALCAIAFSIDSQVSKWLLAGAVVAGVLNVLSLIVSYWIYDASDLYELPWLRDIGSADEVTIVNINAGFDETSQLLREKFSNAELIVLDFFNSDRHSEPSIKRARAAYPPFPGTQLVESTLIPLKAQSADYILVTFAAHEIRNNEERVEFFKEISRVLKIHGRIYVTEHLRNWQNFIAYNIGFFHFYSRTTWLVDFQRAGLKVVEERPHTALIRTFILQHDGTAS